MVCMVIEGEYSDIVEFMCLGVKGELMVVFDYFELVV